MTISLTELIYFKSILIYLIYLYLYLLYIIYILYIIYFIYIYFSTHETFLAWMVILVPVILLIRYNSNISEWNQENFYYENVLLLTHCEQ